MSKAAVGTVTVVIRNQETRSKIAEIAGGQFWIDKAPVFLLFLTDFFKTKLAIASPVVLSKSDKVANIKSAGGYGQFL